MPLRVLAIVLSLASLSLASLPCSKTKASCLALLQENKPCPLFPMLPGTFAPPPGPTGYTLKTLRPGVFHYSDDAYHTLLLHNPARTRLLVIDFPRSPNSFTPNGTYLLSEATLAILNGKKPKRVDMVYSHRHLDHIGSASLYKTFVETTFPSAKVFIWGTKEAADDLRTKKSTTPVPPPTQIIPSTPSSSHIISLAPTLKLQLSAVPAHTDADVLAYIPPASNLKGVLHFVDVVTAREAPFIQFTLTMDLANYIAVHKRLMKLDFAYFSTGHGILGNKKDVRKNLRYTKFVIRAAQESATEVDQVEVGALFGRIADPNDMAFRNGAWALKSSLDLQVALCTRKVIAKWGCRLSVVDVFAEGHCRAAVSFNFVDQ